MLEPKPTKRYGNLYNGVSDIKNHRLFEKFDWSKLIMKKLIPPLFKNFE